ncbi:hypothetical protein [uncultured Umboniibacter sp.]|uniref:hypothetical protein n=1 Tax=uncultured Umboniibacter sp. TaxID=1798917 RepID=UPI002612D016|nr:hypothetical protein [uncultured Umboniibacter sp.]
MFNRQTILLVLLTTSLLGCSIPNQHQPTEALSPAEAFWQQLSLHCGMQYQGVMVSDDEVDADFARANMLARFEQCSASEIRVPFWVGDDKSRTWVFTRQGETIEFRHEHRHSDGSFDEVTGYGGFGEPTDVNGQLDFPADEQTKAVFNATGLTVSLVNVWTVESSAEQFVYQLKRPNRFFRVEFSGASGTPLVSE